MSKKKLFQNRYKVDHGRPHIRIKDAAVCTNECEDQSLHLRLPGLLLQGRRQPQRHADHRRLPGMRQLPRHLHRARQRGLGVPARRPRHPLQVWLTVNDVERFLAHAVQLEREAARRYEELAAAMGTEGNRELQSFFARMAHYSRLHLAEAAARGGFRELPVLQRRTNSSGPTARRPKRPAGPAWTRR
jgi:hypothetical protein